MIIASTSYRANCLAIMICKNTCLLLVAFLAPLDLSPFPPSQGRGGWGGFERRPGVETRCPGSAAAGSLVRAPWRRGACAFAPAATTNGYGPARSWRKKIKTKKEVPRHLHVIPARWGGSGDARTLSAIYVQHYRGGRRGLSCRARVWWNGQGTRWA